MLNLYQVQSFVTVISEGSMTAAADKLFLTQPAISQQIKNLEDDLGVELLVRGVRQIKPTLQGEILYDYAKKILQLGNQAEVAVKAMGAELEGHLRVGTLNSVGVHLMSPLVSRMLKHNPKLSIKIDYSQGEDLIDSFQRKELDVLILPEVSSQFKKDLPETDKKFLFKEEMWLVGSGKDSDMPRQIGIQEFSKYPFILFTGEYPEFNDKLKKAFQDEKVDLRPTIESSNVGTLKRLIESGLGWGFLPSLSVKKQVKMGRLNQVDIKGLSFQTDFFYYLRKDPKIVPVAEVFYQALQQQERG